MPAAAGRLWGRQIIQVLVDLDCEGQSQRVGIVWRRESAILHILLFLKQELIRRCVVVLDSREVSDEILVILDTAAKLEPLAHAAPHLSAEILVALPVGRARTEIDLSHGLAVVTEPVAGGAANAARVNMDQDLSDAHALEPVVVLSDFRAELMPVKVAEALPLH